MTLPSSALVAQVDGLLREAAATLVVPRFRRLQQGQFEEKSPGELVTVVDREVEALLTPALAALRPGSRVVGEEACAATPGLLDGLDSGEVWLVDPLDGTRNFIEGRPDFALMVALLAEGRTLLSWVLRPMDGLMHIAELGAGAWTNGARVRVPATGADAGGLAGVVKTRYVPQPLRARLEARLPCLRQVRDAANCAGVDYPNVAQGSTDFVFYWRTLAWDHAPGGLFLCEAGGHVGRLDGTPYRAASTGTGLLVARSHSVWTGARAVLDA